MARDDSTNGDPTVSNTDFDLDVGTERRLIPADMLQDSATDSTSQSVSSNHVALPIGSTLHEYSVEAVLGCGGFGITYLARDSHLQSLVAIKEYLPNHLAVRQEGNTVCARTESDNHGYRVGLDRFLTETRVLASFRHPNIVRVTRFFEANNTAYMVMDYERGQPLRNWLAGQDGVDEASLLRMMLPLLEGLGVVHKGGVLHRDIKPANIYVRESDNSLVLLDFGAARHASGGTSRSLTSIVTPGYAPFEQYHTHGAQGAWSDIYAIGGVLYWIVTGQKPIEAPSRIKNDIMPKASTVAAGRYSPHFLAAIDWALSTDEEQRPRSVAQFIAALTGELSTPIATPAIAAATPIASSAPIAFAKAGKPSSRVGLIAASAVLVIALGGYLATRPGKAPDPVPASVGTTEVPTPMAPVAEQKTAPQATSKAKPTSLEKNKSVSTAILGPASTEKSSLANTTTKDAKDTKPATKPIATPPQATLIFEISPDGESGEVFVDEVKVGTAPPMRELKVATGKHKIEIHRVKWPGIHHFPVELKQDENKKISVAFPSQF